MRILVAIDFSELTNRVIAEAEKLAVNFPVTLFLLHVIPPASPIIDILPDTETLELTEHQQTITGTPHLFRTSESAKLMNIAKQCRKKGIDTTAVIAHDDEVAAIIGESAKRDADMIMLGSHGHGALFHLLIGSVSEGVIRQASCPVIIVPSAKQ